MAINVSNVTIREAMRRLLSDRLVCRQSKAREPFRFRFLSQMFRLSSPRTKTHAGKFLHEETEVSGDIFGFTSE